MESIDDEFISKIHDLDSKVEKKMDNLEISDAVTEIFNVLRASNKYIDETMPWALAKDDEKRDRLETVLYNLLESIRVCALFLGAYLPSTSKSILNQINNFNDSLDFVNNNSYKLNIPEVLFQRVDKESILEKLTK